MSSDLILLIRRRSRRDASATGLLYRDCLIVGVGVWMWQLTGVLVENWAGRPGFCLGDICLEAFDYAFF